MAKDINVHELLNADKGFHRIQNLPKNDQPFECLKHDYKAASKLDLQKHKSKILYRCAFCTKYYKKEKTLTNHIWTVHKQTLTYKCNLCDFKTFSKSGWYTHKNGHLITENSKIACPVCRLSFRSKMNLKNHLISHIDLRLHNCLECDKTFTQVKNLTSHMKSVHCPKTVTCEECKKSFSNVHLLRRHMLIHSGSKPFSCCYCKHSTNTQGNLMKHIKNIHGKINDTYKDVLIKLGKAEIAPSSPSSKCLAKGKLVADDLFKQLKENNLGEFSLEKLKKNPKSTQRKVSIKRPSKPKEKKMCESLELPDSIFSTRDVCLSSSAPSIHVAWPKSKSLSLNNPDSPPITIQFPSSETEKGRLDNIVFLEEGFAAASLCSLSQPLNEGNLSFDDLPPKLEINLAAELSSGSNSFVVYNEDTSDVLGNITIKGSSEDAQISQELDVVSIAEFLDKTNREVTIHIE